MFTIAVWGTTSDAGRRIVTRLASRPDVLTRALEAPARERGEGAQHLGAAPSELEGVDVLVLLGPALRPGEVDVDGTGVGPLPMAALRSLLGAADRANVRSVVVLSSATVYGASAENPVPLTEQAPLRPADGFDLAVSRAELERLLAAWRLDNPGASAAVLRPVVTVDRRRRRSFQRSVWGAGRWLAHDGDPPVQLLDIDDLAAAVEVACRERLDGPFNVAPDGWLDAPERQELTGRILPVPGALRRYLRERRLRAAQGVAAYLEHPWVVANDRMKAAGWAPSASTEELVVAMRGRRVLGARSRQELSLVAAGAVVAVLGTGVILFIRRIRASRRAGP